MKEYNLGYLSLIQNNNKYTGKGPEFLSREQTGTVYRIHRELPEYEITPLVKLEGLAEHLGLKGIYIKDESKRFGLNAFKGLGGIYALTRIICDELNLDIANTSFSDLKKDKYRAQIQQMVFVTATDGNHGKGVAWAAGQLGCEAHVYLPVGSSELRAQAIRDAGKAQAVITEMNYDDTVRYASKIAQENGWHIVQDTSWEGYEQIPKWIAQGYTTMAEEAYLQLSKQNTVPTHVFLQAGVGAMAGSMIGYLANRYEGCRPLFAVVEPENIAGIYYSVKVNDGNPHAAVIQEPTIMAGLNCGEPCTITWPVIRDFADWYFKCHDELAAKGMRLLAKPMGEDEKIVSGESGAVTLGLVYEICSNEKYAEIRQLLSLDENSVVLCFNTEGDTDPEQYNRIVYSEFLPKE